MSHPAWIEVDLTALVHNAGVLRRAIPAEARLGLMVKANAYGHGLDMGARAALAGSADALIVATLDEGLALRAAGAEAPILVVYPVAPGSVVEAAEARLELTVSGLASTHRALQAWAAADQARQGVLRLHVEVDTGMGRGGAPPDAVVEVVRSIDATPSTSIAGIWSQLADGSDAALSRAQTDRFEAALALLAATGHALPMRHVAATDGVFARTAPAYDMVRVGLGFYGELGLDVQPSPDMASLAAELRPAMTVKARPVRLETLPAGASVGYGREWTAERPSVVATLPLGYADGWTRAYWPGASALLRGRRVPLVGRVSMDSVCVDVTDAAATGEVTFEDELVLLGAQGDRRITPNELARLRGSIPNEVLTAFGSRLPRVYVGGEGITTSAGWTRSLDADR